MSTPPPFNVEYTIVESETVPELIEAVNKHLQEGWELQGGVAVMSEQYAHPITVWRCCQSMTRQFTV